MVSKAKLLIILAQAVLLTACASSHYEHKKTVYNYMSSEKYDMAINAVTAEKDKTYGSKNRVLYYLNLGLLQHDSGLYKDSSFSFAKAQNFMEELYTKSVTRGIGTLLFNDSTTEYEGEKYERSLSYAFRIIDYLMMKDLEGATVETRRAMRYMALLRDSIGDKFYMDDPFVEYLASMVFEDSGLIDDSRISYNNASKAYDKLKTFYGVAMPNFPKNLPSLVNGELVIFHYVGSTPDKISATVQVAWGNAFGHVQSTNEFQSSQEAQQFANALSAGINEKAITVAFPVLKNHDYKVRGSSLVLNGATYTSAEALNISGIAHKVFDNKLAAQRARMIARATIKYVLAKQISDTVESNAGETWGFLARVISNAVAAVTEVADTRHWSTLPGSIRIFRISLPPGEYELDINCLDAAGHTLKTVKLKAEVVRGKRTYAHFRTVN